MKFVDIDRDTLNLDLDELEMYTDKQMVFVNLLGNPINFERLQTICRNNSLILVEDNCESMGAKFEQGYAGTFGVAGTFSSFFSHHISTMEGGITVTDCEEMYQLMISLRAHGWTRGIPKDNLITNKSDDEFMESFRFILPGYNLRPLEMSGNRQSIEEVDNIAEGRRRNARVFQSCFSGINGLRIQKEVGNQVGLASQRSLKWLKEV